MSMSMYGGLSLSAYVEATNPMICHVMRAALMHCCTRFMITKRQPSQTVGTPHLQLVQWHDGRVEM